MIDWRKLLEKLAFKSLININVVTITNNINKDKEK